MTQYDLLVIGGGPAGMAAALSGRRHGLRKVLLAERANTLGGILNQCVHTGFGLICFGEELTGRDYAERFRQQVDASDIDVLTGTAVISLRRDGAAVLSGGASGLTEIEARSVILATGCRERPAGALPITGTRPSGIFTAGMAQKMINLGGYDIGNTFVVLGSGDVGMIVARQLRQLGRNVAAVLEKEAACGGLERNRINCLEQYDIPLRTRCTVGAVHGTGRITGVTVRDHAAGREEFMACDTLITSVGLIPERELSEEAAAGGPLPEWLFLCGNACYVHDLVDEVTLEGERVGKAAAAYVLHGLKQNAGAACPERAGNDSADKIICVACPKGCALTKTEDGWSGAVCGRRDPIPSKKQTP